MTTRKNISVCLRWINVKRNHSVQGLLFAIGSVVSSHVNVTEPAPGV